MVKKQDMQIQVLVAARTVKLDLSGCLSSNQNSDIAIASMLGLNWSNKYESQNDELSLKSKCYVTTTAVHVAINLF